jgi:hypothetical protein
MQLKNMRHHYTPVEWIKSTRVVIPSIGENVNVSRLAGGNAKQKATLENILAVSYTQEKLKYLIKHFFV